MQGIEVDLTLSSFRGSGSIKGLRGGVNSIALFKRTRGSTAAT
jgi:hypothetical protein